MKFSLAILFFIFAALGLSQEALAAERVVDGGPFTVTLPNDAGWQIQEMYPRADMKKPLLVKKGQLRAELTITVLRNNPPLSMFDLPAEMIAKDFIAMEEQGMIEMGVKPGFYTLEVFEKGETLAGDKIVYFMRYRTLDGDGPKAFRQDAQLNLYFPPDFAERHFFYVFLISSACQVKYCDEVPVDLDQILPIIDSIVIKPPEQ